jgi:hypothetical protein
MMTIRKAYIIFSLVFPCLWFFACNDEWKDEQYEKTISFTRPGYTDVYLKYQTEGGVVPYKIPLQLGGTTANDQNIEVTIALDPDTLINLNFDRFRNREDLYFKLLPLRFYELKSTKATIPAGEENALLDIDFKLLGLDLIDKYILPLQIVSTSAYAPSSRKWYKKTMMRIIPFNDYSGTYVPTEGQITIEGAGSTSLPFSDRREAWVVDEKTVFFYAGFIDEQARNRATYKLQMQFNADSTLTLRADSAAMINFQQLGGSYYTKTELDPITPYLERNYTIISLDYRFTDVTEPVYPMTYRVAGSMTMERKRNVLIPEEDQQFIFD